MRITIATIPSIQPNTWFFFLLQTRHLRMTISSTFRSIFLAYVTIFYTIGQEFVSIDLQLPKPLQDFCVASYDNQLVIYGGTTSCTLQIDHNTSIDTLDASFTTQWIQYNIPAIPETDSGVRNGIGHPCTQYVNNGFNIRYPTYGDSIYGLSDWGYYLMIYNISTHQTKNYTTYNSQLPSVLSDGCMVIEKDIIYIIGGNDYYGSESSTVYSYNINTDTWSTLQATLNLPRYNSGCVAWNQRNTVLFVFGGKNTYLLTPTIEMMFINYQYQWILQQETMSLARQGHECIYHPTSMYIYCIGGLYQYYPNTATDRVDVYNFDLDNNINDASNTIQLIDTLSLNIPRWIPSVIIIQDHLFVFGGSNGKNGSTSIEMLSLTSSPTNTPSNSPTAIPSMAPSFSPSIAPSHSPTALPTNAPSLAPSHKPSKTPTNAPSIAPSTAPSAIPTQIPTAETTAPTMPPTASPEDKYIYVTSLVSSSQASYDQKVTYQTFVYVASILIGIVAIVAIIGFCHARHRGNAVNVVSLFKFLLYLLDSVSDTFFCVNLFYLYLNGHNHIDLLLLIGSVIFLILPCLLSLYEMERFISKNIEENGNEMVMIQYFKQHSYKLYVICLLIGNFHATILLFSSRLFDLQTFKLSINDNQMLLLQNKYFIHSTIFENVPQLIISIVYSLHNHIFLDDVVLFTVISGILSIVLSLFTFITRRKIIRHTTTDHVQAPSYVALQDHHD